jgi:hypothetical protein
MSDAPKPAAPAVNVPNDPSVALLFALTGRGHDGKFPPAPVRRKKGGTR